MTRAKSKQTNQGDPIAVLVREYNVDANKF